MPSNLISSTKRIYEVLPHFYRTWDKGAIMYKFIGAFGNETNNVEREIFQILKSRFVDTAYSNDLDNIGNLFNLKRTEGETDAEYRHRIKTTIQKFKGGGTKKAIFDALKLVFRIKTEDIEIIENPKRPFSKQYVVSVGDIFELDSFGIEEVCPKICLKNEEDAEILNPSIENLDTKECLKFNGVIKYTEELIIKKERATLKNSKGEEIDVSDKISSKISKLPTKKSRFKYTEELETKIGVFDSSKFDNAYFVVKVPKATLNFSWDVNVRASFEIILPKSVLNTFSENQIKGLINTVKAAGIRAEISYKSGLTQTEGKFVDHQDVLQGSLRSSTNKN